MNPKDKDNYNANNKKKRGILTLDENQTPSKSKCTLIKSLEKCDIQVVLKIFAVIMLIIAHAKYRPTSVGKVTLEM